MPGARGLVGGAVELHTLPEVYTRLSEVIAHPHCSAADIADIVSQDPGLTSRLLKLANSAMFGFPRRIESVSETVTVVGTRQLRDLALSTSVVRLFSDDSRDLIDMESFWRHSLACGVAAREIAARRKEQNVERFFLSGMLHDIGSLVLHTRRASDMDDVLRRSREHGRPLHIEERTVLGFDHADVGSELLRAWRLPSELREAVAHHHEPPAGDELSLEIATAHVAEFLASGLELGSSGEFFVSPLSVAAWNMLGLPSDCLPEIADAIDTQLGEVVATFLGEDAT